MQCFGVHSVSLSCAERYVVRSQTPMLFQRFPCSAFGVHSTSLSNQAHTDALAFAARKDAIALVNVARIGVAWTLIATTYAHIYLFIV